MSRQFKSIKSYPLTNNTTEVVVDQQGFETETGLNKVVFRTTDNHPITLDTAHNSIKDGYGIIRAITSLNPLTITSSGYTAGVSYDGYDGLLVGNDGYTISRGVIRTSSGAQAHIVGQAWASSGQNHWLLGGYDSVDGYTKDVWHSYTGDVWDLIDSTAPWEARAGALVLQTITDLWIMGGIDAYGNALQDLWHAKIEQSTGALAWSQTPTAENISLLASPINSATIHPELLDGYLPNGVIDLITGEVKEYQFSNNMTADGYDYIIHYDDTRNILWYSKDGQRQEYIIGDDGAILDGYRPVPAFGYVHEQSTASTNWVIPHGLNSKELSYIVYDNDNGHNKLEPLNAVWVDNNTMHLNWNTATDGVALVMHAKYYSGTDWALTDGYLDGNAMWWIVSTDGEYLEPKAITSHSNVLWDTSQDGYMSAWRPYNGFNTLAGRRYLYSGNMVNGNNFVNMEQQGDYIFKLARDATGQMVEPLAYDYTDNRIPAFTTDIEYSSLLWGSFHLRHDGYRDDQDPFNMNIISSSHNPLQTQIDYITGDGGVWVSGDDGVSWTRSDANGVQIIGSGETPSVLSRPPILTSGNIVAVQGTDDRIYRSLDQGNNFAVVSATPQIDTFTWYGSLGITPDASYRLFVYERPSDVIWESLYGHMPGTISDRYMTHYVLPYPTLLDSANTQVFTITLNTAYGRDVRADEFKGEWLYLLVKSTGAYVEGRRILNHPAATAGNSLTLYTETFTNTPNTSTHMVQVIRSRPEGAEYYSVLSRDFASGHTLFTEQDGSFLQASKEQSYDFYADLKYKNGLPAYVSSEYNKNKINTMYSEVNRQRVLGKQYYNDPYTLTPELLRSLGKQFGIPDSVFTSIDLKSQRNLVKNWYSLIDGYGPSLDMVNNLILLMFKPNSGITATQIDPDSNMSGKILKVTVSPYADYSFTWATANRVIYDPNFNKFGLEVPIAQVGADIGGLIHYSLVHIKNKIFDDPILITQHDFSISTGEINIYADEPTISELSLDDGTSQILILDQAKSRIIYSFKEILKTILPYWVEVRYD